MRIAGKPVKIQTGYLPDTSATYSVRNKEVYVGKKAWRNVRPQLKYLFSEPKVELETS
jgi:hypothetical protein